MTKTKKSIKIDLNTIDLPINDNLSSIPEYFPVEEKKDKFHLPVLNLNNQNVWKPLPLEQRQHWTDKKAFETCIGNCCNVKGLKASCCYLDPNDLEHILGPVDDDDIKLIIQKLEKKGITTKREDVVIDFEEGKIIGEIFFNGHEIFKNPKSYPFLRFQIIGPRFACKYLSTQTGKCSINEFKPKMCVDYLCQFVQTRFLVRTPDKPNTYKKIR